MNEPSIGIGSASFAGPRDLERIVDSFEEAWQTGAVPRIDSYLSACENGASRPEILEELIKVDLEYRWRRPGSTTLVLNGALPARPTVDDYARTFPELKLGDVAILELVTEEYRVRRRWGDDPDHDEYLRRFPMHATGLTDALVKIRAEVLPDVTWKSDTPRSNSNGRLAHRSPANTNVIGDHEIIEEIGRGGMGVVYKARHRSLDRIVALKMILSAEAASPEERARFRREAESAARLQHANIVQIHDIGEDAGRPFFSLEYMGGGNLNKHLAGVPQPPLDAARLVMTLAHAIQYAHDRGVVHRDLKPANILLSFSCERQASEPSALANGSRLNDITPKITDFGLAKRLDAGDGATHTGSILGTPSYMAPEQAYGNSVAVGPAADVYALGAILYELLTGRPPFRAASILETLEQVRSQEPVALRQLQPKLPRDIETICLKCLQKDPRRRYSQATDLANDLGAFIAGEPIRARPIAAWERGWKWARRRPAVSALLVTLATALVVLIVGGWVYTERLRDAQLQTEKEKKLAEEHLTKAMQSLEHIGMTVFEKGGAGPEVQEFKKKLLTDLTIYFKTFLGNEDHPNPEIRRWTARAYKGLGMSYSMLGRHADAEAAHRSALAICERLVGESPDSNILRHDLACAHCLLGDALGAQGKSDDAETTYRLAANLYRSLSDDQEINVTVCYNLGVTCHNFGRTLSMEGKAQKAMEWHDAAIDVLNGLLRRLPDNEPTKVTLAYAHSMRAISLGALDRHSEALPEWDQALKALGKSDPLMQVLRARTLAQCGDHRAAVAAAHAVGSAGNPNPDVYVNVSCVYGVAIAAVDKELAQPTDERQRIKDDYTSAALEWLAKAKAEGYFDREERLTHLLADPDLTPLRSSPGFERFVADVKASLTK